MNWESLCGPCILNARNLASDSPLLFVYIIKPIPALAKVIKNKNGLNRCTPREDASGSCGRADAW